MDVVYTVISNVLFAKHFLCVIFAAHNILASILLRQLLIIISQTDRVASERLNDVGTIKVQQYAAKLRSREYHHNPKNTDFNQANKKDAVRKTGGSYTLSTTKKGRIISPTNPAGYITRWITGDFIGELSIQYRMGYTLQEMGIQLQSLAPAVDLNSVKS